MRLRGGGLIGAVTTPNVAAAPGVWSMGDVLAARKAGKWVDSIAAIFADGTDGFYHNFSTLSKLWQDTSATTLVAAAGNNIARSDDSSPRGRNATQATTTAQPKYQTGGVARFDGSDDNLLTTLLAPASFTIAYKGKVTSGNKIVIGSRTSSGVDQCFIQTGSNGSLASAAGNAAPSIGIDVRGLTGVAALTFDGTSKLAILYWQGVEVARSTASTGITAGKAIALGALNTGGTLGFFADLDLYHALAIAKPLTPTEIAAITNQWGTT